MGVARGGAHVWQGSEDLGGGYMMFRDHNGFYRVTGPGIPSFRWWTDERIARAWVESQLLKKQSEDLLNRVTMLDKDGIPLPSADYQRLRVETAPTMPTPAPRQRPKRKDTWGYQVSPSRWWGYRVKVWWSGYVADQVWAWRPTRKWAHRLGSYRLLRKLERMEPEGYKYEGEAE